MKRSLYIFPLMAFTALSLTLAGCDENKTEDTAAEQTIEESSMPPADTTAATETAPVEAAPATILASSATAYATAEGATTGAVFVTLQNPQASADRLLGASTDKAPTAEIHESYVDDAGTMQMRKVEGIDIAAGQQVKLKPGGHHIMLIGLAAPLAVGETFNVTLKFQNAGEVTIPVNITEPGASATDAMGAEMTAPATADDHGHDHSEATDVPATEGETADEATPEPTAMDEAAPAPAGEEPVTDEQPAQ